jgi:hypothetical protein
MNFNQLSKLFTENTEKTFPPVLFHATYRPLLRSINRYGLSPQYKRKFWDDSSDNLIYLATSPDIAESYAESSDTVKEDWLDEIIIFSIDTAFLDLTKLKKDSNVRTDDGIVSTYEYAGTIPANLLKIYE